MAALLKALVHPQNAVKSVSRAKRREAAAAPACDAFEEPTGIVHGRHFVTVTRSSALRKTGPQKRLRSEATPAVLHTRKTLARRGPLPAAVAVHYRPRAPIPAQIVSEKCAECAGGHLYQSIGCGSPFRELSYRNASRAPSAWAPNRTL